MTPSRLPGLKSRWVHFRVQDVHHPDPTALLLELHGEDILQGKVLYLSDSGMTEGAYAVIEVGGVEQPVIVAVKRILGVL